MEERLKKEQYVKAEMSKILEPEAYERLMNVRIGGEKIYFTAASILLKHKEQLKRRITDEELLGLLQSLKNDYEPSFEIRR